MSYVRTRVFADTLEMPAEMETGYHRIGRDYFDVMGMHVREGRALAAPNEIVVSEGMAKELAPNATALGRCVRLEYATSACRTVVGVVNDTRDMRLDGAPTPGYYVLSSPDEDWQSGLIVRARSRAQVGSVQLAAARLSTTSFAIESYAVSTLVAEGRRDWQAGAVLLSLLAIAAILLSVLGLSASIAEDSARRMHEFAIRSAIGAKPIQLAALVAGEGMLTVLKMFVVCTLLTLVIVMYVRPLLFGATVALVPSIVASVVVAMVVLLATSFPALHLRHVDAAEVLRATI
jgi:hypothetical protein